MPVFEKTRVNIRFRHKAEQVALWQPSDNRTMATIPIFVILAL